MKKTLKIIGNVLLWIFIVFAIFVMITTIVSIANKEKNKGVPSVFGKSMISIQSDSMAPVFKEGYMIFGTALKTDAERTDLKVNDVITFLADLNGDGNYELNSHRIIDVVNGDGDSIIDENGNFTDPAYPDSKTVFYKTKGDNNPVADSDYVRYSDVVCVWHDGEGKIAGLGGFVDFLQSSTGFLLVIVLPCAAFFIFELVVLIKTIVLNREKKLLEKNPVLELDEEEIKRKAVEEYIKSQQEKADNDKSEEDK